MSAPVPLPISPDPRSRTAAARRERMRDRLLEAVLDLYQPGQGTGHVVIDDVIRLAAVSRGTFYKYFESVEAAVAELGEAMTAGMIADYRRMFDDVADPLVRAVGGSAIVMLRALHDPRWCGFTCRVDFVDYFSRAGSFDLMVRDALEMARGGGQMRFGSLDVAVDLIVGMTVEGRRRLLHGVDAPRAYMDEMIERTFCGLDAPRDRVIAARDMAWRRLRDAAPTLDWWSASAAG